MDGRRGIVDRTGGAVRASRGGGAHPSVSAVARGTGRRAGTAANGRGAGGRRGAGTAVPRAAETGTKTAVKSKNKSLEVMRKFSEQYCGRSGTYFCSDKSVTATVIKGLAANKDELGAPLCPCRYYDDKAAEAANGFWNCPCVPMRERKECHCMLFLTEDNPFAGKEREITMDELEAGIGAS